MSYLYILNTLSNMHVGSGEMNFGIVDNQVQRDVITNYPTIHSSSLKGAIREHFENNQVKLEDIEYIFGADSKSNDIKAVQAGKFKFFSANLLVIPLRSNKLPFYRTTSSDILKQFLYIIESFKVEAKNEVLAAFKNLYNQFKEIKKPYVLVKAISQNNSKIKVEDFFAEEIVVNNLEVIESVLGEHICILPDHMFSQAVKNLPVLARNCLEKGMSCNLWYEEVVPRESKFYFPVIEGQRLGEVFNKNITEYLLQIGANASIGYGFTEVINIKK